MKTAIATWNNRIAPVFDSARSFLVIEDAANTQASEVRIINGGSSAQQFVMQNEIDRLVCGAICRETEQLLLCKGIEIVSFVAGSLDEVVDAIKTGALVEQRFSMPGCSCPRRRCGRRRRGGWRQFSDNV